MATDTKKELLPCPFCGAGAVIGGSSGRTIETFIECKSYCGANVRRWENRPDNVEDVICISRVVLDRAIAAWNTRSLSPTPTGMKSAKEWQIELEPFLSGGMHDELYLDLYKVIERIQEDAITAQRQGPKPDEAMQSAQESALKVHDWFCNNCSEEEGGIETYAFQAHAEIVHVLNYFRDSLQPAKPERGDVKELAQRIMNEGHSSADENLEEYQVRLQRCVGYITAFASQPPAVPSVVREALEKAQLAIESVNAPYLKNKQQWRDFAGATSLRLISEALALLSAPQCPHGYEEMISCVACGVEHEEKRLAKSLQHRESAPVVGGLAEGWAPTCDKCGNKLTEPGALLFAPPDTRGWCLKQHICYGCFTTPSRERAKTTEAAK